MATFKAYRLDADGCREADSDRVIATGSLEYCRRQIAREIKVPVEDLPDRKWASDEDVEAYRESEKEGCGGWGIRPAPIDLVEDIGLIVFGPEWRAELRAALDISRRTLDCWEVGSLPVGRDHLHVMLQLCMEHKERLNKTVRRIEMALREEG